MKILPNNLFFEEIEYLLLSKEKTELKVKGTSMRPYLRDEVDVVVLSPFNFTELKQGDIVLFRYKGKHLLHRIIKRNGTQLTIQGDGVIGHYEETFISDVVGLVRKVIRRSGKQVSTQSFSAHFYWRCWLLLRPFRRYLLAFYDRFLFFNYI